MCKSLYDVCACVGGSVCQTRGVGVEEKVDNTWIQLFITIRNEVSIFVCVSNDRERVVCVFISTQNSSKETTFHFAVFTFVQNTSKENQNRNPKTTRFPQSAFFYVLVTINE